MVRKHFKGIMLVLISLLLVLVFVLKPAYKYLSVYLTRSEQVKANILLVEGWLPDYAIRMAYDEFRSGKYDYIVTTGQKTSFDYFGLYSNGYLIFYPGKRFTDKTGTGLHTIQVDAYSELGGENKAHMNVFVNDSIVNQFYTDQKKHKYLIRWQGRLEIIDSLTVQFDNDNWGKFGDRNLFIRDLVIDDSITIPYINNSAYVESKFTHVHEYLSGYSSNAESAAKRLIALGVESSKIIAVPCEKVRINRTLTSALAFRDWVAISGINIKGINILSMGAHSRRTWMSYNKILDEKYSIGVISLPDYHNSKKARLLTTIRETIGILYYWIILIPY